MEMSEQYRKWTGLVSSLHNSNRYYQLFQYTVWLLLVLIVYRINQNIICRKRLFNIRMYYVYYTYIYFDLPGEENPLFYSFKIFENVDPIEYILCDVLRLFPQHLNNF